MVVYNTFLSIRYNMQQVDYSFDMLKETAMEYRRIILLKASWKCTLFIRALSYKVELLNTIQ